MRLLLIEDDLALAKFLRRGLELEGHSVTHATDGESGAMEAAAQPIDLIVLDLNLPRRDGLTLLRDLRAAAVEVPVIVLTGRGSVEERITCLDAGADDFVVKPFSFHELAARCRALVRRRVATTPAEQTVRHGALQMDRLARVVLLHGVEIGLTAKEFALLDYLMQNRPRAVSRPELLEKVWKMPADSGTNVVDVYINYLRRKLRTEDGLEEIILTVRGSGYALAPEPDAHEVFGRKIPVSAAMLQNTLPSRVAA